MTTRDPYCPCPSCRGTQIKDGPCYSSRITPAAFGASNPVTLPLMSPSASMPVIKPLFRPQFRKKEGRFPVLPQDDFQPDDPLVQYRKRWKEFLRNTREQHQEMQEVVVLNALGMTREQAMTNLHRISRHCHPDQDVFLLDGEPVVAIHKPVIRGDELVTAYQILRKLP